MERKRIERRENEPHEPCGSYVARDRRNLGETRVSRVSLQRPRQFTAVAGMRVGAIVTAYGQGVTSILRRGRKCGPVNNPYMQK